MTSKLARFTDYSRARSLNATRNTRGDKGVIAAENRSANTLRAAEKIAVLDIPSWLYFNCEDTRHSSSAGSTFDANTSVEDLQEL